MTFCPLQAYFQNGVEVRHVHLTKNYDIPGDPIGSLPNVYNFTGSPARLFLCIDTRMQSFALVRDNESESLLMFYTTQMQFNFTFANNIEFDIVNNQGRLTLFCTFPSIDYAKLFFQLVRGSNSDYEVNIAFLWNSSECATCSRTLSILRVTARRAVGNGHRVLRWNSQP